MSSSNAASQVAEFSFIPDVTPGELHMLAARADGTWTPTAVSHGEFTTSHPTTANASLVGAGTVTNDATKSSDTAFATAITDGINLVGAGIYALEWSVTLDGVATGRTFLAITPTAGEVVRASLTPSVGENVFAVMLPNLYITAGTDVVFQVFKTTASTGTIAGRIRATKIG
jgi:hypothetical protein